uniref:Uncharacterized protein n=1 Tax=Rhizophora mucronata TaxID=61149 RepID=A0A2P2Q2E2_RHIMU
MRTLAHIHITSNDNVCQDHQTCQNLTKTGQTCIIRSEV